MNYSTLMKNLPPEASIEISHEAHEVTTFGSRYKQYVGHRTHLIFTWNGINIKDTHPCEWTPEMMPFVHQWLSVATSLWYEGRWA